jgi:hypothetical protein
LNGIVDNTVFRLELHEKNLATRVLSIWQKVSCVIWEDLYGVVVYGFETFVVEEIRGKSTLGDRTGALYRADNWTFTGITAGNAKNHDGVGLTGGLEGGKGSFSRKAVVPKLVYCKWRSGFSEPVRVKYKSSWRAQTKAEKEHAKLLGRKRKDYLGKLFLCRGKNVVKIG